MGNWFGSIWSGNLNFTAQARPGAAGTLWHVQNSCYMGYVRYDFQYSAGNLPHAHVVRKETLRIFAYLDFQLCKRQNSPLPYYGKLSRAVITGTSGAGKSTEVWGWLGCQAARRLWICHLKEDVYHCVRMNAAGNQIAKLHSLDDILSEIGALNYDIIVLDGSFPKKFVTFHRSFASMRNPSVRFPLIVICSSERTEGVLPGKIASSFEFGQVVYVRGHTRDEYLTARRLLVPNESVAARTAYVDEQFYFAGASGRLFFEFDDVEEIGIFLRAKINQVSNLHLLLRGGLGAGSPEAVNSLLNYTTGNNITSLVSEFVSRYVSKFVDHSFIEQVKHWNSKNPTWQGWVAELEMLWIARQCHRHGKPWCLKVQTLRSDSAKKAKKDISALIDDIVEYDKSLTNVAADRAVTLVAGRNTLFIPECWNNEAFDAVLVVCPAAASSAGSSSPQVSTMTPHMYFIKCTLATSHSHDVEKCSEFLQALWPLPAGRNLRSSMQSNVVSVHYVIATTSRNAPNFLMGLPVNSAYVQNFDNTFGKGSMMTAYFDGDAVPDSAKN